MRLRCEYTVHVSSDTFCFPVVAVEGGGGGGGVRKCEGVNGSDSCFLLSCSVLLRQNPANKAVSVLSDARPICFAPKRHSDD